MAVAANGPASVPTGATECMVTSAGTLAPRGAFAAPLERGRRRVPPSHCCPQPVFQVLGALGILTRQRPADHDTLDRLGQVQPGAAQRGVERHYPMSAQPTD